MKKITLVVAAVLAMFSANVSAQNVELPKAGSFGTEVQFNPFDQDGHQFQLDALKFRYFITDNDALRLNIGFGFGSEKGEDSDDMASYKDGKAKWGDFNIDLGYERHWNVAKRLDLYAGAQIGIFKHFASASATGNADAGTEDVEFKGYFPDLSAYGIDAAPQTAHFGVSAAVFTGLDFYVYKGLYVGTELGLSIKSYKTSEGEVTTGNQTIKGTTTTRINDIGFKIQPTLRLGWTF